MPIHVSNSGKDKKLANEFASFDEMDQTARAKLQIIGQAQKVLREAFRDLDSIFDKMQAMISQRGEERVLEPGTKKLPGINAWWTGLCEEYGVNFSFSGFQKKVSKRRNKARPNKSEVPPECPSDNTESCRSPKIEHEQLPGDWVRLSEYVECECGAKVAEMLLGVPRELARQLLLKVALRLLGKCYREE